MAKRVLHYDILNVVSCMSVVLLHSNGHVHDFAHDGTWWLNVLIEVVCFFAVPVFFMLTGATLMRYSERYSTRQFFDKRIVKTVVPYVLWGLLFYAAHVAVHWGEGFDWRHFVECFATGKIPFTNYWFFIPLFLIYAFMPFLSPMVLNLSERRLGLLLVLLICLQSIMPALFAVFDINWSITLPIGGYVFYALAGYYLSRHDLSPRLYALTGLGALVAMVVRYAMVYNATEHINMEFSYFGLHAVLPALFIFESAKRIGRSLSERLQDRCSSVFKWLAGKSFGIYLVHSAFIIVASKALDNTTWWYIPIAFVLAYAASLLLTALMQCFKLTRFLVP